MFLITDMSIAPMWLEWPASMAAIHRQYWLDSIELGERVAGHMTYTYWYGKS